jgi:hypothetical protein
VRRPGRRPAGRQHQWTLLKEKVIEQRTDVYDLFQVIEDQQQSLPVNCLRD